MPYISILSDPTTGGVFASFSALGDVNIAEPNALIGFAGARVAAGTTGDELPEGSSARSSSSSTGSWTWSCHGASCATRSPACWATCGHAPSATTTGHGGASRSMVAPARTRRPPVARRPAGDARDGRGGSRERRAPAVDDEALREAVWARVQMARNVRRPHTLELVGGMATDVVELHGDRRFGDDPALVGGFATIGHHRVVFMGHQKGGEVEENIRRNFGMPHPEGYRKAGRLLAWPSAWACRW